MSGQKEQYESRHETGELKKISLLFVLAIAIGLIGFLGNRIRRTKTKAGWPEPTRERVEALRSWFPPKAQEQYRSQNETSRWHESNGSNDRLAPDQQTTSEIVKETASSTQKPTITQNISWQTVFDGYGSVEIGDVISLAPKIATTPNETHAALVRSETTHKNPTTINLKMRTVKQLRQNSPPNPWEVAWIFFNYQDLQNYHYFILKPNGVELGKKQGSLDQIFLQTSNEPRLTLDVWHDLTITLSGSRIQIAVDGSPAIDYTDPSPPLIGRLGLYTEDAQVEFKNIVIE